MVNEEERPNLPVARKSDLTPYQASFRLVKRGVTALENERRIFLEGYLRLVAYEASVFVFPEDWDSHRTIIRAIWNESDTWRDQRRVVLFEFHWTGAYVRKVTMPLIEFTAEGYADIRKRRPGEVTIRSKFLHFFEDLEIGKGMRPVRVRVDYLFTRTGERLAVWSDSDLVDRSRQPSEPSVPIASWLKPEWADETRLMSLDQRHNFSSQSTPRSSSSNEANSNADTPNYFIIFQDVEQWVTLIAESQAAATSMVQTLSIPFPAHNCVPVDFPSSRSLYKGAPFYLRNSDTTSNPGALWFLGVETKENEAHETLVWKMEMSNSRPQISTYTAPHPYDLLRQGIIALFDGNENGWMPSESDYQLLKANYDEQFSDDSDPYLAESYDGKYSLKSSWGDDLIVTAFFGNEQLGWDGDVLLLFKVEHGALRAIRLVEPYAMIHDAFTEIWEARLQSRRKGAINSEVRTRYQDLTLSYFGSLRHESFADGQLFSIVDWFTDERVCMNAVVVTNVNTEAVAWFWPEVPESEFEHPVVPQ